MQTIIVVLLAVSGVCSGLHAVLHCYEGGNEIPILLVVPQSGDDKGTWYCGQSTLEVQDMEPRSLKVNEKRFCNKKNDEKKILCYTERRVVVAEVVWSVSRTEDFHKTNVGSMSIIGHIITKFLIFTAIFALVMGLAFMVSNFTGLWGLVCRCYGALKDWVRRMGDLHED